MAACLFLSPLLFRSTYIHKCKTHICTHVNISIYLSIYLFLYTLYIKCVHNTPTQTNTYRYIEVAAYPNCTVAKYVYIHIYLEILTWVCVSIYTLVGNNICTSNIHIYMESHGKYKKNADVLRTSSVATHGYVVHIDAHPLFPFCIVCVSYFC